MPPHASISDEEEANCVRQQPLHRSQVEVISYIESMLLGDPFRLLSHWPALLWLRGLLPACSPGRAIYKVPPLRKAFHWVRNPICVTPENAPLYF